MKIYRCKICGYEIEADELPDGYVCPLCGVSRDLFEVIEDKNIKVEEKVNKVKDYEYELIEDKNDKCIRVSKSNLSITKVVENCINCGLCKKICKEKVGINYEDDEVKIPVCINCGQCVANCPKDALRPKQIYKRVSEIIAKKDKVTVISTALAISRKCVRYEERA